MTFQPAWRLISTIGAGPTGMAVTRKFAAEILAPQALSARAFATRTGILAELRPTTSAERGLRRLSSAQAAPVEGLTLNVDERVQRVKHRVPQKRASFLLSELRSEQKQSERCEMPEMKIGDAIQVTLYENKNASRYSQRRGVLIRKVKRGVDSTILLRDVINGNSVESHIPLYSPLIRTIEVMETAFIYQGKLKGKRVRPARIYYIRDLDQKFYRVTGGGGSQY